MSTSMSIGSSMCMEEDMVSCLDFGRTGDRNGFLASASSSDVSTGVKAGVRRRGGGARIDCEKVLMCCAFGDVRNGRGRILCEKDEFLPYGMLYRLGFLPCGSVSEFPIGCPHLHPWYVFSIQA